MEPQLPTPYLGPEAASQPQQVTSGETFRAPKAAEVQAPLEQGKETREVLRDAPMGDPAAVQVIVPPLPVIDPAVIAQPAQATAQDDTNPTIAADDDLIEKEWVEKAKRVVAETRNDPHAQDAAVNRLQADYLKKRYGKDIMLPSDG